MNLNKIKLYFNSARVEYWCKLFDINLSGVQDTSNLITALSKIPFCECLNDVNDFISITTVSIAIALLFLHYKLCRLMLLAANVNQPHNTSLYFYMSNRKERESLEQTIIFFNIS